jgi:hypothetical protein
MLGLRRSLRPQLLNSLPAPLGFQSFRCCGRSRGHRQHDIGPDEGSAAEYSRMPAVIHTPCDAVRPTQPLMPRPPPLTCFASGGATAVSRTVVPGCTFNGSDASAFIACDATWMSGRS